MPRDRQLSLDMVRGVAILLVVLFHLYAPTGIGWLDVAMRPVAVAGWAGVDLFFVLSGYLVGGLILDETARTGGLATGRFFARRALRLWPVLWLYLALLVAGGAGRQAVWPVLFHVQNYVGTHAVPSHLWSLAVEEHFYLIAAFALPWLARRGAGPMIGVLVAVIVGVGALRILALGYGEALRHAQWQTQYRIDALAAGVLIAAVRRYRPDVFVRAQRRRAELAIAAVAGFAWLAHGADDATRYGIGLTVAWASAAALVLASADLTVPARWRWPARLLGGLGTIAYSLYVWHASAAQVAGGLVQAAGWQSPVAAFVVKLSLALGVGALVYRWVERPFLRLRDQPAAARPMVASGNAMRYH